MKKTYRGSCHCGAVRYEADIEFNAGTAKCNCSICGKLRYWGALIEPDDFRLLSGESALSDYRFNTKNAENLFCKHCGVHSFHRGFVEAIGGAYVSINLACLDDLEPTELLEAPVKYKDGRNNNWLSVPSEARHL